MLVWQLEPSCSLLLLGLSLRRVSVKDFFGLSLDVLQQFTEFCTAIGKKAALLLVDASLNSTLGMIKMIIFLQSDAAAAIFFVRCLFSVATTPEQLLFESSIYFIGKSADSNDGWIKLHGSDTAGLIDAGSSACSLSVRLLVVKTSLKTQTAL